MTDVLGFGVVSIDEVLYVERQPPADGKTAVLDWFRRCGGLTGMALQAAARLGSVARYAGCLGDDELSLQALEMLAEAGVDVSTISRIPDARPYHAVVVVDTTNQTRTILFDGRGSVGAHPSLPPAETIAQARVILVDGHGLEGMVRAIDIGRAAGAAILGDFESPSRDAIDRLLPLVDHLIVSAGTAHNVTGSGDPAAAVRLLWRPDRKCVAVTHGAAGVWYTHADAAGDVFHLPAYPVQAVDTTGCGDVFHGAYAHAIARDRSPESAIRFASAAAAAMAMRGGPDRLPPDRTTVESILTSATGPLARAVGSGEAVSSAEIGPHM